MTTTKKKRSFDAAFKLRVVEYAEQDTSRGAGRKFGVDENRVREWRKQKYELQTLPTKKYQLPVRKCHFPRIVYSRS